MQNKWNTLALALFPLFFGVTGFAQELVPARPLFEEHLRDPAITRAPNGVYYLTGTLGIASKAVGFPSQTSGEVDFANTLGIWMWKSTDLKAWTPLGKVFDMEVCGDQGNQMRWTQYFRLNPDHPAGPRVRGVQSPELHFVGGLPYIAFAMSGGGTGLLRSSSGKAEGPYVMHARLTTLGQTPSLFQDDDGSNYWLWDGGWIAKLSDNLTELVEQPRFLRPTIESTLGDFPLQVGYQGAFIFKFGGRYHLVASELTTRLGAVCHDTFVSEAKSIYGPYGPRRMMIPHGGQVTLFTDGKGDVFSTFGGDPAAVFMDKPGIVPLVDDGFLKHLALKRPTVTEGGPISALRPIELPGDYGGIRDPQILLAPDGFYYLTGTTGKSSLRVPGCRLWRSKDLKNWEALGDEKGVIWYVDESEWTRKPFFTDAVPGQPVHDFWAPEIHFIKGNYYIPFCMFGGGTGMLTSVSGRPEGPYEDRVGQLHSWAGDPSLFQDDDGTVYMHLGFGPTQLVKMKDDMSGFDGDPFYIGPVDGSVLGHEGGYLVKMENKYVLFYTTQNGLEEPARKAMREPHDYATYDFVYCWSENLRGPYSSGRTFAPHGGHGAVFKDKTGRWLATMFGTDMTAPFRSKLGIYPLHVEWTGSDLIIRPTEK